MYVESKFCILYVYLEVNMENRTPIIEVAIEGEYGYELALKGLSLNKNQPIENMADLARKLCNLDEGHNKFLESIYLWINVKAARYFWQEADTYRLTTKQSESTMHTIMKRKLIQNDFCYGIPSYLLDDLNLCIENKDFIRLKRILPESFLQRRLWVMNYKTLRNIIHQRRNHKLEEWLIFIGKIYSQAKHIELLPS